MKQTLNVTVTLDEATKMVSEAIQQKEGCMPLDELNVTIELPYDQHSIYAHPEIGTANKIFLIKLIREAQVQFTADASKGDSTCMSLVAAKAFVEKYLTDFRYRNATS